jgi:hypothetical protein
MLLLASKRWSFLLPNSTARVATGRRSRDRPDALASFSHDDVIQGKTTGRGCPEAVSRVSPAVCKRQYVM